MSLNGRTDLVLARIIDAQGTFIAARTYGRDAGPNGTADVAGYAERILAEDEARLGRPRARSGAVKVLRAAGFAERWCADHAYVMAMDRRGGRA